jgi:hypothetical protein
MLHKRYIYYFIINNFEVIILPLCQTSRKLCISLLYYIQKEGKNFFEFSIKEKEIITHYICLYEKINSLRKIS